MRALCFGLLVLAGCPAPAPAGGGEPFDAGDSGTPRDSGTADAGADAGADGGRSDGGCVTGCLLATTLVGHYTQAEIAAVASPGVTVENGYSVYTIEHLTDGRRARATVAIPYQAAAPDGGWHVIANAHGTVGIEDPCVVAGTVAGAGLAGLFGARGVIGVAPDYPGLGTEGIHPYLVAKSEGRAVLDAVRATRALAGTLGVPLSGRVAITGLSQGGHASLSAAAEHQGWAPELDVKAFAASGPASAFEEHWRYGAQFDGPYLAIHAMLVYAWAKHYGYTGPALWTPQVESNIDAIMANRCATAWGTAGAYSDVLGSSGAAIFSPGFLQAYRSGSWGAYAAFHGWFDENRVKPYRQTAPLRIYQGTADDTVLAWATTEMVAALTDGGVQVDYVLVPDAGHVDLAFGYLAYPQARTEDALQWLRARLAE